LGIRGHESGTLVIVARLFAALVFISTLVQSTGLSLAATGGCGDCCAGAAAGTQAGDGCESDSGWGDCSPTCERCLCCTHHRVVALTRTADSRPIVSQALTPISASAPDLSSDPGEIMHVPKRTDSVS
jgi:hypothetical protein